MNRQERAKVARDTLKILSDGWYTVGQYNVQFKEQHEQSVEKSTFIPFNEELVLPNRKPVTARIQYVHSSTLSCLYELSEQGLNNIGVLNFASAKHPGGGFLNGSLAQEESLAYSSGLYSALINHSEYYMRNRASGSPLYLGNAIFTPHVVFFRDDEHRLREHIVTASVLSIPAVNFGEVLKRDMDVSEAHYEMKSRMRRVLEIFAAKGIKTIILGDFGCGVFKNNRDNVRQWWSDLIEDEGYGRFFKNIYYTIYKE